MGRKASSLSDNVLPISGLYQIEAAKTLAKRESRPILVCRDELEADILRFEDSDLLTTAIPDDGSKRRWKKRFTKVLQECDVVLLSPNEEEAGRELSVAAHLLNHVASSVRVVNFPEMPVGQGAREFVRQFGPAALLQRIEQTVAFVPKEAPNKHAFSDVDNGLRFAEQTKGRTFYCPDARVLMCYDEDERVWTDDERTAHKLAIEVVQRIPEEMSRCLNDAEREDVEKHYRQSKQSARVKAMVEMASKVDRVSRDVFDSASSLLNVRNGTVDLETGEFMQSDPKDLFTKKANFDFDPAADSSPFEELVLRLVGGDEETAAFLKRAFGLAVTGKPSKAFFVLYGSADAGKSTPLVMIANVLGGFAYKLPAHILVENSFRGEKATPAEYAKMPGVRFAYISETRDGDRMNVREVKELTSLEELSVNPKYRDPFKTTVQFKLFISTNNMPTIEDSSDAIFKRLKPIRCDSVIEQPDPNFIDRFLGTHRAGIGRYLIEGAREYLLEGLGSCPLVDADVQRLKLDSDPLEMFLEQECTRAAGLHESSSDVLKAFIEWNGSDLLFGRQLNPTSFGRLMAKKGYPSEKFGGGLKHFIGIKLGC
jgi:putative DNA primase/helicase